MVGRSLDAAEQLAADGVSASVLDVHTISPFPTEAVARAAAGHGMVLTVEEHNTVGGLGSMVAEAMLLGGVARPLIKHGVPDEYAIIGPPHHQYRYYGLDAEGIVTVARRILAEPGAMPFGQAPWGEADHRRILAEHA